MLFGRCPGDRGVAGCLYCLWPGSRRRVGSCERVFGADQPRYTALENLVGTGERKFKEFMVRAHTGKDLLSVEGVRSQIVEDTDVVELFRVPRLGKLVVREIIPHRQCATAHAGLRGGQCERNLAGEVRIGKVVHEIGRSFKYHSTTSANTL